MRCATKSGRFQCTKQHGHAGECEAQGIAAFAFGPYRDAHRGHAYIRGWLDAAHGAGLDVVGAAFSVPRAGVEDDCTYRERVWRAVP